MTPEKWQEYREEAERLAQLPRDDQAAVVGLYRSMAANPLATKACRAEAARKAEALAAILGLERNRKPTKAAGKGKTGEASAKTRRKR
jgi:hypothetical protein